jgi:hypothetical protein
MLNHLKASYSFTTQSDELMVHDYSKIKVESTQKRHLKAVEAIGALEISNIDKQPTYDFVGVAG